MFAIMSIKSPWYKTSFQYSPLGTNLKVAVPHDVFSTQRIDEGTLLLLENLPATDPRTILDMGCGYGALGLPIAAKYSNAQVDMVDRDLLAAHWSQENAQANQLSNVRAYGSLGFRDVKSPAYDWILCNVPARIGNPFIENFIEKGRALLNGGGELRVVVIRDLGPVLEEMRDKNNWPLVEVARGPRHAIYSIGAQAGTAAIAESETLYLRDQVQVGDLLLDRPFDIGGDDQKRVRTGLPVLLDTLPRQDPDQRLKKILCFRSKKMAKRSDRRR
jgi:16S rRNA (guanine1207-N2)-methyltransferase